MCARLVYLETPLDLSCGDGELGGSPDPAASTSSQGSASRRGAVPARTALEALPYECDDQDHDADLTFLLAREARDAPGDSWLHTQPVLSARHRRFLVSWMQRVSSMPNALKP